MLLASMIFSMGILEAQPGMHGGGPGHQHGGGAYTPPGHQHSGGGRPMGGPIYGRPQPGRNPMGHVNGNHHRNPNTGGIIISPRVDLYYHAPYHQGYRGGYHHTRPQFYDNPGYGYGPQFNFNIQRRPFVCSHPGSPHTRRMERRIERREFRLHMRHERLEHRRMRRH